MLYIAENLKKLRKEKDLTQEEVAVMVGVTPQSVSKWERGDAMPDITLLPTLANLYMVTIDAIVGMDKINEQQTRNNVFLAAHDHIRNGDINAAVQVYTDALKLFPNDEGIMSDLAISLVLSDDPDNLSKAVDLCERALSDNKADKVHHTTRAALCFIYMKNGEKDKATEIALRLPHVRESRENILAQLEDELSTDDIDKLLRFIGFGEADEQSNLEIDFGIEMVAVCSAHDLLGKLKELRNECNAPQNNDGYKIIPQIQIRDKTLLSPHRVRVRYYADYLLDKEYDDPAEATGEIVSVIRSIAAANSARLA